MEKTLEALGLDRLLPVFEHASKDRQMCLAAVLELDDALLRQLGTACIEVAAVRSAAGARRALDAYGGGTPAAGGSVLTNSTTQAPGKANSQGVALTSRGVRGHAHTAVGGGGVASEPALIPRALNGGFAGRGEAGFPGKRDRPTSPLCKEGQVEARAGKRDRDASGEDTPRVTRSCGNDARVTTLVNAVLSSIRNGKDEISLSKHSLGDDGAAMIAPYITSLTSLDLSINGIGPRGLRAISNSVCECPALASLHLGGNPLGDEGGCILADILKGNTSITSLRVPKCEIGPTGLTALAEAFLQNFTIRCLDSTAQSRGHSGCARDAREPKVVINTSLARNKTRMLTEKLTAFAMGTHERLGAASSVNLLGQVTTSNDGEMPLMQAVARLVLRQELREEGEQE